MCAGSGVHSEHAISFCFDMSLARCSGTSMERQKRSRKMKAELNFYNIPACRPLTHVGPQELTILFAVFFVMKGIGWLSGR
jgi:hypothetical protein